ncbi:NAD(P)(+) transhydrogenase (Re/Si-specific) subunit alpha, partial [Paracoccus sp. PS-1]|nr:NAD(P)(+) transhydrogenase (Re/Si-specific) subunit alpha [Paracoccus sp. PS1]
MKIGGLRERFGGEARVAVTPSSAAHLQKLGHEVCVEAGAGVRAGFSDAAYEAAGVSVHPDAAALIGAVDVVVKVRPPTEGELRQMRRGQVLISHFWPAQNPDLLE